MSSTCGCLRSIAKTCPAARSLYRMILGSWFSAPEACCSLKVLPSSYVNVFYAEISSMCVFCLIFKSSSNKISARSYDSCFERNESVYFSLFSAAPHVAAMVFLIHFCSRTPQQDDACWMEDRLSAYCATSAVQTNKRARTWKRQMESHGCPGSKQRESVRWRDVSEPAGAQDGPSELIPVRRAAW